jgi:hypothetical protein
VRATRPARFGEMRVLWIVRAEHVISFRVHVAPGTGSRITMHDSRDRGDRKVRHFSVECAGVRREVCVTHT